MWYMVIMPTMKRCKACASQSDADTASCRALPAVRTEEAAAPELVT